MALLPPGTGGSGVGGTVAHNDLPGRDVPNAHPVSAITGLADRLEAVDAALAATEPIRYFYTFSNTTTQDVILAQPLDNLSLALIVVRVSDGAMIEPEVTYLYGPDPMRYIERIRLGFSPPISGQYVVHIVR